MEMFLGIIIFILGTCVGSFINMLVYRTAERYGLRKGAGKSTSADKLRPYDENRSFCDWCGRQLKWYENVPVVSWVIQKGRTKCCGNPLPWEYPIVEMGMGIIFLLNFQFSIFNFQTILKLITITLLIFSTVFDLKYMILPDFSTYILIGIAFFGVVFDEPNIIPYLLSALGAFGFLGLLYVVTKGKGMGFGDVKLAIFMGLFLGWPNIIVAFYLAFIIGAVVGVGLIVLKIRKRNQPIPFGPFLILGTVIAYFYGEKIMYYFSRWL